MMGDYYRSTDVRHISLGFQLANPVTLDIKNYVPFCLSDNTFDRQAIIGPWEYLTKFYETC